MRSPRVQCILTHAFKQNQCQRTATAVYMKRLLISYDIAENQQQQHQQQHFITKTEKLLVTKKDISNRKLGKFTQNNLNIS